MKLPRMWYEPVALFGLCLIFSMDFALSINFIYICA